MDTSKFQCLFVLVGLGYPDVKISPRLPLAQAVLESANFTSSVYATRNNFLGMKAPSTRETTCTNKGQAGAYAAYTSALDCIRDYFLWARYWKLTDDTKLAAFINTKYAEDPAYGQKIKNVVASLDSQGKYIKPAVILAGGAGLATALGVAAVKGFQALTKN